MNTSTATGGGAHSDGRDAKRILLVDDDDGIQESLSTLLSDEGYEVCASHDGQDALDILRARPPDLIILDLMMPLMDGWQFRTVQLADPNLSEIPVIAISADASAKAQAIDADHYLRKPFRADDLLLAVERTLLGRERQKLSERLREAERIALLGTMAASVGHEINNPLTYVLGNLQLLGTELAALDREVSSTVGKTILSGICTLLSDVATGAERIQETVGGLHWLSRPRTDSYRVLDLSRLLKTSMAIAFNEIRHRARLEKRIADLPAIRGDEARLGHVFVNLLVNAAQAIPPGAVDTNRIVVTAAERDDYIVVEVRDSGCGIPTDLQASVFEPFFTTKDSASGTGLGLAISLNIVREHGGRIELDSAPGKGSAFRVFLPVRSAEPMRDDTVPRPHPQRPASRRLRVLVVDDDVMVLSMIERMLSRGHSVLRVTSARGALERIATDRDFDAILCDLMMPEMTGMDFHAEATAVDSALASRIVFMTGGAFAPEARAFLRLIPTACLYKPFTLEALQVALLAAASRRPATGQASEWS